MARPEEPDTEFVALLARFRQFKADMIAEDRWDCCKIPAEFDALREKPWEVPHGRR